MLTRRRLLVGLVLVGLVPVLAVIGRAFWQLQDLRRASAASAAQDFRTAYELTRPAVERRPDDGALRLQAARLARRAGLAAEAERHLEEYRRRVGRTTEAVQLEWHALRASEGDPLSGRPALLQAASADSPHRVSFLEALVQGHLKSGGTALLEQDLARLFEAEPDNLVGHYAQGVGYALLGRNTEARDELLRVLERRPDHDDARLALAEVLLELDPDEAAEHLGQLRRRSPEDPSVRRATARYLRRQGRSEEAAQELDTLLTLQPESASLLVERGWLEVQSGRAAAGEPYLRKALTVAPKHRQAHARLYQCLLQQPGRAEEAEAQRRNWERLRSGR